MYRHILVAVGPGFSEAALSTAIERARDNHARLTILHVTDHAPQCDGSYDSASLVNQLALVVRRSSETMLRRAGIDADWMTRSLPENGRSVGGVIASEAERLDVDLIVLGARKSGLFVFGANHVRNAVCRRTSREVLIATEKVEPKARVIPLRGTVLQAHHA